MEINSAFDLLQDLAPIEQLADSTENLSDLKDSDFQALLAQVTQKEAAFFAELDQALPDTGKLLPLDVESSSQLVSDELTLFATEFASEEPLEAAAPETDDPIFIMTNLLLQSPSLPVNKLWQPSALDLAPAQNNALTEQSTLLNPVLLTSSEGNQPVALTVDEALPAMSQEALPVTLATSSIAKLDMPVSKEEQKHNTLSLADNLIAEEQPQIAMDDIVQQAAQLRQDNTFTQSNEKFHVLLEPNQESEVESANFQEQTMLTQASYSPKETVQETLVVAHHHPQSEEFSAIFEEKLTDKITLLVNRQENAAQIQIDPPELGKIDISIEQSDDKTHIKFFAQVEQTKQLIENTLDKLKLHFAQNGLELGQVDVSAGNQHSRQYAQMQQSVTGSRLDAPQNEGEVKMQHLTVSDDSQLLDLYI